MSEFLAEHTERVKHTAWHAHLTLDFNFFRIRYSVQVIRVASLPPMPGIRQSQFVRVTDVGYAKTYDAALHLASEWAAKDRAMEALKTSDPPAGVGDG